MVTHSGDQTVLPALWKRMSVIISLAAAIDAFACDERAKEPAAPVTSRASVDQATITQPSALRLVERLIPAHVQKADVEADNGGISADLWLTFDRDEYLPVRYQISTGPCAETNTRQGRLFLYESGYRIPISIDGASVCVDVQSTNPLPATQYVRGYEAEFARPNLGFDAIDMAQPECREASRVQLVARTYPGNVSPVKDAAVREVIVRCFATKGLLSAGMSITPFTSGGSELVQHGTRELVSRFRELVTVANVSVNYRYSGDLTTVMLGGR